MKCDNCGKKKETKQVSLLTGKRGRPPIRNWCATCIAESDGSVKLFTKTRVVKGFRSASPEATGKSLSASQAVTRVRQRSARNIAGSGFDPAALFLLEMQSINLFEPADGLIGLKMRCKGCRTIVRRSEINTHFETHKKELQTA